MSNSNFKKLSDYREEIHRCSKCGLCQAQCPLYEATGNECTVSRGQFIMLDGVIKGKLELGKNINKYLDLCLKCNKCSEFCPSDIEVVDILLAAKHEYFKRSVSGKIYSFLESKYVFDSALNFIRKLSRVFCPRQKSKSFESKAVYFGGCISALRPDVMNFVTELLNKINIEVVEVDMNCCGMPFLSTGNIDRFQEAAENNLRKIPEGVNTIITDCASCEWAWKQYKKYIADSELKKRLDNLQIINIYELLDKNGVLFAAKKNTKVSYHKPCHENSFESIERIIKGIENLRYVPMEGYDSCCGFAGYEHPSTILKTSPVRNKKKKIISSSECEYVLTSCAGCLFSLSMISDKKVRRVISFLKDNCKIR